MSKYKQKEFKGIVVNIDKTDINENYCVDCHNIDISTKGFLKNISGSVKQNTTGLGAAIDGINYMNGNTFVFYNGTIATL